MDMMVTTPRGMFELPSIFTPINGGVNKNSSVNCSMETFGRYHNESKNVDLRASLQTTKAGTLKHELNILEMPVG